MPRNLNAWLDICFILFAALILTGILTYYNLFIGLGAGLVWLCLLFFGRERCLCRSEEFEHYCHTVISNVNSAANYALKKLPQVMILVDKEGRIQSTFTIRLSIGLFPPRKTLVACWHCTFRTILPWKFSKTFMQIPELP